jgi:hypothetical protein
MVAAYQYRSGSAQGERGGYGEISSIVTPQVGNPKSECPGYRGIHISSALRCGLSNGPTHRSIDKGWLMCHGPGYI